MYSSQLNNLVTLRGYTFNPAIVKVPQSVINFFAGEHKLSLLVAFLILKRLSVSGTVKDWRKNERAIKAIGSKPTLIRRVKELLELGLAISNNNHISFVSTDKLLEMFGQSGVKYFDNDETLKLKLELSILRASEKKQLVKIKYIEKENTEKVYKITCNGTLTTTGSLTDVNYSCRRFSHDLGCRSAMTGYRHMKKLAQSGLMYLTKRISLTTMKNLSYEFETVKSDVRKEWKREQTATLRRSFAYCSNDCVGE